MLHTLMETTTFQIAVTSGLLAITFITTSILLLCLHRRVAKLEAIIQQLLPTAARPQQQADK
jgi:hypothetical protein